MVTSTLPTTTEYHCPRCKGTMETCSCGTGTPGMPHAVALPEHGTTARAKGRSAAGIKGCPCRPCRQAEDAYDKRRRYLNATGRTLMVDATPAHTHLLHLFAAGAGWAQLASLTGCSTATLTALRRNQHSRIRRATAAKILEIKPGEACAPCSRIDSTGSVRRIRALMAIGHPLHTIADHGKVGVSSLRSLNRGTETVTSRTARGIAEAYNTLSNTPGTSSFARNRAAADGWASPAYWDDDTLDDPSFVPATIEVHGRSAASLVAEDIRHLGSFGVAEREIAARVGRSHSYVREQLAGRRGPGWRQESQDAGDGARPAPCPA